MKTFLKFINESSNSKIWKITPEEYCNVEKPSAGFDTSVSFNQLSSMSQSAKDDRIKIRLAERNLIRTNYQKAEELWKTDLIKAYNNKEFTLKDVEDTENDALYVILELINEKLGTSVSPFKLRRDKLKGGNLLNELEEEYAKLTNI